MNEGFKITETPIPEKPPQVKIPTVDPVTHRQQERVLSVIPDSSIGVPEKMSGRERNDAFEVASLNITNNVRLEKLVLRGIKGDQDAFAEGMNLLTKICISLDDKMIDDLVRNFNRSIRTKALEYARQYQLNPEQLQYLQNGVRMVGERREDLFNPIGIKSVARFVRSRLKLHSIRPETVPAFYFENYFDAKHKIDLIEIFDQPEGIVMNLIQIKSREYTDGQIEKNIEAHREWVNGYAVDLNIYEKNFEVEPEDSNRYKEFFADISHVEDLLIDAITGEGSLTTEILFEKLEIKDRPNVERIWILSKYIDAIKEAFVHVEDVGLTDEQLSRTHGIIAEIETKLASVLAQKKDLKGISEIHSICTVGERQVSDVVIFRGEGGNRKAINMKN